jgi:hypothetical protein
MVLRLPHVAHIGEGSDRRARALAELGQELSGASEVEPHVGSRVLSLELRSDLLEGLKERRRREDDQLLSLRSSVRRANRTWLAPRYCRPSRTRSTPDDEGQHKDHHQY